MKVIKITALILTAVFLSACTKNDKGVEQLNSIESRWDDAISLAGSTPKNTISKFCFKPTRA